MPGCANEEGDVIMEKKPFLTEAMAQQIIEDVPTPFRVYDEKGIRENVRRINKAFSWNRGGMEYFAVKALPEPCHPADPSRRRAAAWIAPP